MLSISNSRNTIPFGALISSKKVCIPITVVGFIKYVKVTDFPALRRFNYSVQAQIGRFLAYCLLGSDAKFFAPGQTHTGLYTRRGPPLVGLLVVGLTTAFPFVFTLIYWLPVCLAASKQCFHSPWTGALGLVLAITVGLFLLSIRGVKLAWTDLRAPSQNFLLFGGGQHPMPRVRRPFESDITCSAEHSSLRDISMC